MTTVLSLDSLIHESKQPKNGACEHPVLLTKPSDNCGTCLLCHLVLGVRGYEEKQNLRVLVTTKKGTDGETDVLELHGLYTRESRDPYVV